MGLPIKSYIPLHLMAFKRSDILSSWIESWVGQDLWYLQPKEWFLEAHDSLMLPHLYQEEYALSLLLTFSFLF